MNSVMGVATTKASHRLMEVARGTACPVTGGHAMRVTKGAWEKLCAKMRKSGIASGMGSLCSKPLHLPYNACLECKGKRIPSEVSIIDAAEVRAIEQQIIRRLEQAEQKKNGSDEMGTPKKRFDHCSLCGNKTNIFKNFGVEMCSNCANVTGHLSNRLPVVAKAAVQLAKHGLLLDELVDHAGKPWFVNEVKRYLPTQVTVDLEQGALDAIAEIIGYRGQDADGLVDEVRRLHQASVAAVEATEQMADDGIAFLQAMARMLRRRESALWELVGEYEELQADRDEVAGVYIQLFDAIKDERCDHHNFRVEMYRALSGLESMPIPGDATLVRMAAESEATLEQIARATNQIVGLRLEPNNVLGYIAALNEQKDHHTTFLIKLRQALGVPIGPVEELLSAINTKNELLDEYRVALNAKHDTVVAAQLAQEEAEQKLLADEQIFAKLREVLGDDGLANGDLPVAVAAVIGQLTLLDQASVRRENIALNSRLLSLLIDYPEVGVERIAEIRGVA